MLTIRNFLFHRVSPQRDELWDPMSVELFEKCIKYITKKYYVLKIEDLPEHIGQNHKKCFATISFDDGYKDNIINALPILTKYNVKASFYVVTDCINFNKLTWTHQLEFQFANTKQTKISLDFDFLPKEFRVNEIKSREEKIMFVKKLKPLLKKVTHEQRKLVLERIDLAFNDLVFPKLMMNWDDLRELVQLGHAIGSHTVSHCMLGTIEKLEEAEAELINSAKEIQLNLGFFPKAISYPVGSYNKSIIELSKKVGYELGLAVKQDIYLPDDQNLFEIPRIELYNESWWKTRLRITHTLEKVKKAVFYKK